MIRMIRKTVISSLATPHSRRASSHLSPVKSNDSEHQPLSSKKEQRQVYSPTTKGYRQWGQDHSRRRFLRQHQLRLVFHSISSETQYFATLLSVSRSITIKSHSIPVVRAPRIWDFLHKKHVSAWNRYKSLRTWDVLGLSYRPWPRPREMQLSHRHSVDWALRESECTDLGLVSRDAGAQEQDRNKPAILESTTTAV